MIRAFPVVAGLATMIVFVPALVHASLVTQGGFSGTETVITFNELGGVTPAPGPFSIGSVTFSEASTGLGSPGWRLLPVNPIGGSGVPILTDNASISDIRIDFNTPVNRAGLLVGIGPATYEVSVYDTSLNLLESATFAATGQTSGGFIGFEESVLIGRLRIVEVVANNSLVGGIDDVRFELVQSAAVPEPSTLALGIGLVLCVCLSRRRTLNSKCKPTVGIPQACPVDR